MKRVKFVILSTALVLLPALSSAKSTSDEIKIGSWHIRSLSSKSRSDDVIRKIADMLSTFDLIALQGVVDKIVLDRIKIKLPGWKYITSMSVEDKKEGYAFFWNAMKVENVGTSFVVGDPHGRFVYDPYVADFKCGTFDFTMINIRIPSTLAYREKRYEEVGYLDELVDVVQRSNGDEQDIILLGNFFFSPSDSVWELKGWQPLFNPPHITTVAVKMLADNIWHLPAFTKEFTGKAGIIQFDKKDYANDRPGAIREMSDHRPLWASFNTRFQDDDDYGRLHYPIVK